MHLPSTRDRARKLRKEMSLPEVLLWVQLKQRPGGHKFRKQHPFGRINADFYCDKARLVIEVDGESHNRGDQPKVDRERDAFFAEHGIRSLRITANDVLSNMDGVIQHIVSAADAAVGPLRLATQDTSPGGRGFSPEHRP